MRLKKFNNGAGAILCNTCRTIVVEGSEITKEDMESDEPIYCKDCKRKKEMLSLKKLENDTQLDEAIAYMDKYLDTNDLQNPELKKLSELVYEYEKRTGIQP